MSALTLTAKQQVLLKRILNNWTTFEKAVYDLREGDDLTSIPLETHSGARVVTQEMNRIVLIVEEDLLILGLDQVVTTPDGERIVLV
jgi:hypothetical protein